MTGTDVLKLIASMSEFGYSRREISYAMDIPLKDIKRLLRATG